MEKNFDEVFAIMDEAFPNHEMRTYEGQQKLLRNERYHLITKENEQNKLLAFMAVWEFDAFCFIEHLAVNRMARGKGIGGELIKEYLHSCKKPVVLEVEPPENEVAARRIAFYRRLGFKLNVFHYEQPPLRKESSWCTLLIMSYPYAVDEKEFAPFKQEIYRYAYGIQPRGKDSIKNLAAETL